MALSPFPPSSYLPYWTISLYSLVYVHGIDFIPERVCGTLFSQNWFEGDSFTLNDFDVSADLSKDYRVSLSGWLNTSSITVEDRCSMYICTEPYFQGTCYLRRHNLSLSSSIISQVRSANCTCSRECNCNDIILPYDEFEGRGRAYFKGGCQRCDTEYLMLLVDEENRINLTKNTQTFKIRSDCNLSLYNREYYGGNLTEYSGGTFQNNFRNYASHRIQCNKKKYIPPPPKPPNDSDPPKVSLPESLQGFLQLVSNDYSLAKHPGIQVALRSIQKKRSWKNAYILVLGTQNMYSSVGMRGCRKNVDGNIMECRVVQPLDGLGISNSEVRIIYYSTRFGLPDKEEDDFVLMASLDKYMSNHEDLKYAIPNAVVLYRDIQKVNKLNKLWLYIDENEKRLLFQRQLRILNGLRTRLVNESYSNVIFYVGLDSSIDLKSLDSQVQEFETEISSNWTFPKPILVVARGGFNLAYEGRYAIYVNGLVKMVSGEYLPLNLIKRLRVICRGSGDALGEEIFKQMLIETGVPRQITFVNSTLLPKSHNLVHRYRTCSENIFNAGCFNAAQTPQAHKKLSKVEEKMVSEFLNQTYEICYCTAVRERVISLEKSILLTQDRLNRSERKNTELELKFVDQSSILENLNAQVQQLDEQLEDAISALLQRSKEIQILEALLKLSEEQQIQSTKRHASLEYRIQMLEEKLTVKSTTDDGLIAQVEELEHELIA